MKSDNLNHKPRKDWTSEDYGVDLDKFNKIINMYKSGLTLQKIGNHFGITRSRAQQLLVKAVERQVLSNINEGKLRYSNKQLLKERVKEQVNRLKETRIKSETDSKIEIATQKGIVPDMFSSITKYARSVGISELHIKIAFALVFLSPEFFLLVHLLYLPTIKVKLL